MNTNNHYDVIIIGAGIIGLSVAETLSHLYKNILHIDKEKQFGTHISSRNSEVGHSGLYYPTNSLEPPGQDSPVCTRRIDGLRSSVYLQRLLQQRTVFL